jgi:uncharacterized protein (TIGR02680 family)
LSDVLEMFSEAVSGADLPRPTRERFQLLRAGILNLWQYDEQELRFEDGRLILRGENGTGKSKALELLLPFLLDADLSPQRLDPFGGTSRTMEWNLLQDGRYESRVGYVWLELGRRVDDQEDEHWTLGCGLRASQRTRRVDSWYFLTRLRVGEGLTLLSHRTPLLRDQLRQQISGIGSIGDIGGDRGWVFDTGREYREKLDLQIFGLGEDRFATLRHLLLQLRRPHLSERLDPQTLSETLKESLPPLDPFLIGQLSESFERLDNDQKELARVESAAASVGSFVDLYRDYGRGMARGRGAEVRQADSRYHKTAAEMREAEEGHRLQDALCAELAGREQEAEVEADATRGRLRALEQSDAMRSAEALRAKRDTAVFLAQQAARSRDDSEMESRRAEGLRRELERAESGSRQSDTERDDRSATAQAAAREADLDAIHAAAVDVLPDRPPAALATVRSAVRRQEEGIAELRRLAGEHDRSRMREELARDGLREVDAQVRAAAERSQSARAGLDRQRESLHEALLSWSQGLAELRLDDTAFAALQDRVEEMAGGGQDRLAIDIEAAAVPSRDALVRSRASLQAEAAAVAVEEQATMDERRQVAEARELGPEPPRTRAADRSKRSEHSGAPLYLLCDFAPDLGEAEQAGLEAALEAAGLLDAWITPVGGVLSPDTLDTWLVPVPVGEPSGRTLRDVLVPAPGHGVSLEILDAVLRSIDLDGGGLQSVGTDGRFRLGVLQGAWTKPVAEHVGAGAREAARQRRLAELDIRLAALAERLATLAAQIEELDERLERLRQETASLPSTAPILAAWHQAEAAAGDEARRRTELAAAGAALAGLRSAREDLERRLQARARELDLANHLNDLEGYRERLHRYETAFERLVQAAASAVQAREHRELAGRRVAEAVGRLDELRLRAQEIAADAEAARAEHEELEATVGADVREILRLHQEEARRLDDLKARRRVLDQEARAAAEQRARFQERLELRRAELAEREDERARAVVRLRTIVETGWLPLVLSVPSEEPEEPEPAWSLTRALELAREIDRETHDVDLAQEAADRRAKRLWERFQSLAADLGADYQPRLDQDEELLLVRVAFNGRDHDVKGLLDALRESIEVRRALLADHERELLRRFLLGEVGDHLRNRLRQARALVGEMNDLLERCRTASGMALKLAWDPVQESAPEVRDAVGLLNRDFALLQDAERLRLEAFFQARISDARDQWEAVPWREHLMAALDYRSWYRFRILRRTGEGADWTALHLPLFAAAAAHYRSARSTAPRLILLDEAFAGIDQGMRGRCMGLLVALDLDFLMTSHDEWGCYEELPAVATYQLYRDPTLEGVAAVRMVWNGRPSPSQDDGA